MLPNITMASFSVCGEGARSSAVRGQRLYLFFLKMEEGGTVPRGSGPMVSFCKAVP